MTHFTDETRMPFGKYKGTKLANVPASYLLWLYEQIKPMAPNKRSLDQKYLLEYIEDNKEISEKENKR